MSSEVSSENSEGNNPTEILPENSKDCLTPTAVDISVPPAKEETGEIQTKMSNSLSYLQEYNSDDGSSDSENDEIQDLQFHDLEDDLEDSESNSAAEEFDSISWEAPTSEQSSKPSRKEFKTEASWMSDFGVDLAVVKAPDISTLELNNKEEFLHIGNIDCVLDKLVTIQGLPNIPAYDLDTLLFLENGQKVLGYVFDVMGPVTSPIYVVHLESAETARNLLLRKGTTVYSAPKSKYTKYVFVHELMKIRGSDASWVDDTEIPPEFEEFSDDEKEKQIKAKNKVNKRRHNSLERHQEFESNMNKINQLNSRLHNMAVTENPLKQRPSANVRTRKSRPRKCVDMYGSSTGNLCSLSPPPPRPFASEYPYDGTQTLHTYFQNCTSQFRQTWEPRDSNPQPSVPSSAAHYFTPNQYYTPSPVRNSAPSYDPTVPPPSYVGQGYFLPDLSRQADLSHLNQRNMYTNGSSFRQNNRPGPSNGN